MKVIVYSRKTCIKCTQAKKFLNEKDIKYTVKDIDNDEEARNELVLGGFMSLPVILVDDKAFEVFNKEELSKALGI